MRDFKRRLEAGHYRYEHEAGTKYWDIFYVSDPSDKSDLIVMRRWGVIGSIGQIKISQMSPIELQTLIRSKNKKGYELEDDDSFVVDDVHDLSNAYDITASSLSTKIRYAAFHRLTSTEWMTRRFTEPEDFDMSPPKELKTEENSIDRGSSWGLFS